MKHQHTKKSAEKIAAAVNENQRNAERAAFFAAKQAGRHEARKDGGKAFVRESDGVSSDVFATEMGRDFLSAAETGVEVIEELSDESMPEDAGGPFQTTAAATEFAEGVDASNPPGATREPFPTPMRKPD